MIVCGRSFLQDFDGVYEKTRKHEGWGTIVCYESEHQMIDVFYMLYFLTKLQCVIIVMALG